MAISFTNRHSINALFWALKMVQGVKRFKLLENGTYLPERIGSRSSSNLPKPAAGQDDGYNPERRPIRFLTRNKLCLVQPCKEDTRTTGTCRVAISNEYPFVSVRVCVRRFLCGGRFLRSADSGRISSASDVIVAVWATTCCWYAGNIGIKLPHSHKSNGNALPLPLSLSLSLSLLLRPVDCALWKLWITFWRQQFRCGLLHLFLSLELFRFFESTRRAACHVWVIYLSHNGNVIL